MCFKKLFKPKIDRIVTDSDGIMKALVHNSPATRLRAVRTIHESGLDAFRYLTPPALAEACAKTGLLVKRGPFEVNLKDNVLLFLFIRALLDQDLRLRREIADCLASIDSVWFMHSIGDVDKNGYVALEKMGLTHVPRDLRANLLDRMVEFRTVIKTEASEQATRQPVARPANERQIVSEVIREFVLALQHTDFDKIRELVVPEFYQAASHDTLDVHLVSIPNRFEVTFKGERKAVVKGQFDLQVPGSGKPDVVRTTAKFLLMYKTGKWMLYNYSWRDYLLDDE